MALFLDTSAVIKLVRTEPGSELVEEIARRPTEWGGAFVSDYATLEVYCCLARFRRQKVFSGRGYDKARRKFEEYLRNVFVVQPSPAEHIESAATLAAIYRDWKIGSLDFLQACGALSLAESVQPEPVTVVVADGSFAILARQLGFDTFDPERDDLVRLGPPKLPL